LLAFAGLYETRFDAAGEAVSCAIVTTSAAPALAAVHDRMPRLLTEQEQAAWLDPAGEHVSTWTDCSPARSPGTWPTGSRSARSAPRSATSAIIIPA